MPSNIDEVFNKDKYSIKELAYLCNKDYYYVLRSIKDGLLEAQKVGKAYIIDKSEAIIFFNNTKHEKEYKKTTYGQINFTFNFKGVVDHTSLLIEKIEIMFKEQLKLYKDLEIQESKILISKTEQQTKLKIV